MILLHTISLVEIVKYIYQMIHRTICYVCIVNMRVILCIIIVQNVFMIVMVNWYIINVHFVVLKHQMKKVILTNNGMVECFIVTSVKKLETENDKNKFLYIYKPLFNVFEIVYLTDPTNHFNEQFNIIKIVF